MREIKFRVWDKEFSGGGDMGDLTSFKDYMWPVILGRYGKDSRYVVMQYTGLKDKNGKEIYEGDIVKRGKTVGKIVWNNGGFRWHTNFTPLNFMPMSINFEFEHEIIGNIYENPKLLNKEGK